MRAVILAAGRGRRVGRLTEECPKCLLRLAGRPLIEWQITALTRAGVKHIAVVRGYRGELLERYPVTLIDNPDWASSNVASSLMRARSWLADCGGLISYSDIVYATETVRCVLTRPGDIVIAYDRDWRTLWQRRMADPLADAEIFRLAGDGAVAEIGGRASTLNGIEGQYMGLIKVTAAGWRAVMDLYDSLTAEARTDLDTTTLLSQLIQRGVRIDATPTSARWMEIDTEADLRLSERMVIAGELALDV